MVDYRKLNDLIVEHDYPLPNISDLFDQLGNCQYFTTLDRASDYHEIEIHMKDIQITEPQ